MVNDINNITIREILNDDVVMVSKKDIMYCLSYCLNKNESFLVTNQNYVLTDLEYKKLEKLIFDLRSGKPLSYVLGNQPFYKYDFYVDENVLIPRSETEIIIDKILGVGDQYFKKSNKLTIIDLGTGSGCIGISLAIERPEWNIVLVDKFITVSKILKKNLKRYNVSNARFILSDWLDTFAPNSIDIIVANPPYVDYNCPEAEQSVKLHEPQTALFSCAGGYEDLKKIIIQAKSKLRKGGMLLMENGFNQSYDVKQYLQENEYKDINILLDYNKIERFTLSKV